MAKKREPVGRRDQRLKRLAAKRLRRAEVRKTHNSLKKKVQAQVHKKRTVGRRALREQAAQRREILRQLAHQLAQEKRGAEHNLIRKARRVLLRQRYVMDMKLNASGTWSLRRASNPTFSRAAKPKAPRKVASMRESVRMSRVSKWL